MRVAWRLLVSLSAGHAMLTSAVHYAHFLVCSRVTAVPERTESFTDTARLSLGFAHQYCGPML